MDLTPYVEKLQRDLAVAAEAGGPDARALAERLTGPLESAARLALLEALSTAAGEITRDLAPGSVDLLLRGGEPAFVVTPPAAEPRQDAPGGEAPPAPGSSNTAPSPGQILAGAIAYTLTGDDGGTARMTLRLPDQLKARAEEAAAQQGISVNAWLVRVVSAALEPGQGTRPAGQPRSGRSYTGWVR